MSDSEGSPFSKSSYKDRIEDNLTQYSNQQNSSIIKLANQQIKLQSQRLQNTILQGEVKNNEKQLTQDIQSSYQKLDNEQKRGFGIERKVKCEENRRECRIKNRRKGKERIINANSFSYELLNQNSIHQNDWCCAITFNQDQSIVVAGCNQEIGSKIIIKWTQEKFVKFKVYAKIKQLCLWVRQVIGNYQWNCQQKLIGHLDPIFCLLLNNNDDLIISCSPDSTINFWTKQNQWICQQTISDHRDQVYSLSLNEQQNKLISCSQDSQILVIEQSISDKTWYCTQKIKVDQFGYRLCFINDNFFTFQPYCQEQMHVYEMDSHSKLYNKTKEIPVKCGSINCESLFPQQYLQLRCFWQIKMKENGDFIIEQSIEFDSSDIFGQLSNDREYLIIWDYGSKAIQIRKYKEL